MVEPGAEPQNSEADRHGFKTKSEGHRARHGQIGGPNCGANTVCCTAAFKCERSLNHHGPCKHNGACAARGCFRCGDKTHWIRECPRAAADRAAAAASMPTWPTSVVEDESEVEFDIEPANAANDQPVAPRLFGAPAQFPYVWIDVRKKAHYTGTCCDTAPRVRKCTQCWPRIAPPTEVMMSESGQRAHATSGCPGLRRADPTKIRTWTTCAACVLEG